MYARVYGKGRNYKKQNSLVLRERTLKQREDFYSSSAARTSCICLYGPPRKRERPHEKDSRFWEKLLEKVQEEKLRAALEAEKLNEEKLRVEEEKVEELKKEILLVQGQDLHVTENAKDHHTDDYDCVDNELDPQAVVRRGQEFKLTLTFQRPWEGKIDDMHIIFKLGERPNKNKGTLAKIKLEEGNNTSYKDGPKKEWGARILEKKENSLTIAVYSPPNAVIGEWEFAIRTEMMDGGKKKVYESAGKDDIIIILNPYCHDDQVFMPEHDDRREYVENEHGISFYGSAKSVKGKAWNYGQFQPQILEVSLHLLRKAFDYTITKKMSSPVHIARALSRILNDNDDMGVLTGNWSGNYTGGKKPTSWKGSQPILTQYYDNRAPVKYGQCWVFSHVLTSVARALGFPCRSVTNFSSAHDTDHSLTIDKYVDEEGDFIKSMATDSVWNFHVWNEVWMRRPDLDKRHGANGKYDGWHAVDATPQELSENMFQCGPSPVAAIRNGEMDIGYDTGFIFAEVNADVCHWRVDGGNDLQLVQQQSNKVGKKISTKSPSGKPMRFSLFRFDEDDRLDVTDHYKHPEGSIAEREAVENALGDGNIAKALFNNPTGIKLEVVSTESPKVGEDFTVTVKVENTANEKRSLRISINVRPMTYWGDVIGTQKIASKSAKDISLDPNGVQTFDVKIEADRYLAECDAQLAMSVLAMVTVSGFDDHECRVCTSEDIEVEGPKFNVEGPKGDVKAGNPVEISLEFTNPLNVDLTNCFLSVEGGVSIEGDGFDKKHNVYQKKIDNIKAKESRKISLAVTPALRPKRSKEREVEVNVICDQLPDIEGSYPITLA